MVLPPIPVPTTTTSHRILSGWGGLNCCQSNKPANPSSARPTGLSRIVHWTCLNQLLAQLSVHGKPSPSITWMTLCHRCLDVERRCHCVAEPTRVARKFAGCSLTSFAESIDRQFKKPRFFAEKWPDGSDAILNCLCPRFEQRRPQNLAASGHRAPIYGGVLLQALAAPSYDQIAADV